MNDKYFIFILSRFKTRFKTRVNTEVCRLALIKAKRRNSYRQYIVDIYKVDQL